MTASEWLLAQGLSLRDIDFIETMIVNQAVYEQGGLNQEQLVTLMLRQFPHHTYRVYPIMTMTDFSKLLVMNNLSVNGREIISRFRNQGLCTALCIRMLEG
ncbi:hypothetical protein [Terribacillus sp. 7520-G]|uniref:hypothetical protein n=1 Tax=Terribacillus TaxID=459532 RepID=UPI000BA6C09A|nr:hypothetical protein [Terribacillus sp. 7520-G]PAD38099.1 hypothetical protein CHH53_13100 [Terribacillus sp. 7520-G]